jgi:hypothetical protein
MRKRFAGVIVCTLIAILLMSPDAIGRAITVAPPAVLINSKNHFLVEKNIHWYAEEATEGVASLRRRISGNRYQLSDIDFRKLRNCFRSIGYESKLDLTGGEPIHTKPSTNNVGVGPVVSRLSDEIIVAYWPANPNQIIPIDMLTKRMVDVIDGADVVSIDVHKRAIVLATCGPSSNRFDIHVQLFGSMSLRLLAKVELRIVDMTVRDGVIFAVAKTPGSKKLFGSGVFAAAGHGQFFENWFVLEISLESGEVQSFPIARNLKNASAFFPTKWDLR